MAATGIGRRGFLGGLSSAALLGGRDLAALAVASRPGASMAYWTGYTEIILRDVLMAPPGRGRTLYLSIQDPLGFYDPDSICIDPAASPGCLSPLRALRLPSIASNGLFRGFDRLIRQWLDASLIREADLPDLEQASRHTLSQEPDPLLRQPQDLSVPVAPPQASSSTASGSVSASVSTSKTSAIPAMSAARNEDLSRGRHSI